jgi:hypothetical protein
MFKFIRSKLIITGLVAAMTFALSPIALVATNSYTARAQQQVPGEFRTGDLLIDSNQSAGDTDWFNEVNAYPGDVIEFNMLAQNVTPDTTLTNVRVKSFLPASFNSDLVAEGHLFADNAFHVQDTSIVHVLGNTPQGLDYIPGHVWIVSPSCPNGCAGPDTITGDGVNVGSLNYGESAQVLWKAYVTNFVVEQPTPTPTPTEIPTPPPTFVPTPPPTLVPTPTPCNCVTPTPTPTLPPPPPCLVCQTPPPSVPAQVQNQQQTQNNNQNQNVVVNVPPAPQGVVLAANAQPKVVATAGTQVTTLPKTGLPLAAWAVMGMLPAGAGLKKFGRKDNSDDVPANFIWEEREFKKS